MLMVRRYLVSTAALAVLAVPAIAQARVVKPAPPPPPRHSSVKPAPAPTPTPTPPASVTVVAVATTPTPQAVPVDTTLDHLTQTQSFSAYQSTVKEEYKPSGPDAGKPLYYSNFARVTAAIQYDAAKHAYTVRDTGNTSATSTFAPANIVGSESNASYTVYRKTGGGSTETLTLLNPGATNPTIQLSYASFGHWRKVTPGGGNFGDTAQGDTYFVYGFKTPKDNMPTTGTATYSTLLDGTYTDPNRNYDIDGTGTVTANFANSSLAFSASATGTPTSGSPLNFGTIAGNGTITSKSSSFTASGSNGTYGLNMAGYFFGPSAAELGAVFQLTGRGGNGNGAMVGKQP